MLPSLARDRHAATAAAAAATVAAAATPFVTVVGFYSNTRMCHRCIPYLPALVHLISEEMNFAAKRTALWRPTGISARQTATLHPGLVIHHRVDRCE